MARAVFKELGVKRFEEGLKELWRQMLEGSAVGAILLPVELESRLVAPALVTGSAMVERSRVLSPYMATNSARLLQMITKTMPPTDRWAVVLRPCEARAAVELCKLKQISQHNLTVISVDCPGTYPLGEFKSLVEGGADVGEQLLENAAEGKRDQRLREACRTCVYPSAPWADIKIGFLNPNGQKCLVIEAVTEAGEELMRRLGMQAGEIVLNHHSALLDKIVAERKKEEQQLLQEQQENLKGPEQILAACVLSVIAKSAFSNRLLLKWKPTGIWGWRRKRVR